MPHETDQQQQPAVSAGPKPPAFLTIFPSIMLPMFLAVVDQTIVATALPAIAAATGEVERASWIVVSYLIAATVAAVRQRYLPEQHELKPCPPLP